MLDWHPTVRAFATLLVSTLLLAPATPGLRASEPTAEQATAWLQRYIETDSSTLEGARKSGTFLRGLLHQAGVATKWIVSPTGQPFLYARTEAAGPETQALMLLHHLDAVPAGSGWSHSPFGAEIEDGVLYGRGAIDDKSLGIAHLVAFLRHRRAENPARAVVFLAVGGEETGGTEGTGWLVENHPELFDDVSAVLTEGGSNRVYGEHLAWWGIEVAQKRPLWMTATATGRPGHGSSLNLHSAPHRLLRGLAAVVDRPLDFRLTPEARLFLESLAPLESQAFRAVIGELDTILQEPEPVLRLLPGLPNYLLDSVQVNVLEAGQDLNVTPAAATARIDARLLPDTDEEAFLAELQALAGPDVKLEVLLTAPQSPPSPTDHPIYACLERQLGRRAPVVPAFITAITDARYLRQRGLPAYGFSPFTLGSQALRGIHSNDEHIPLDAFVEGVETMWEVVRQCAAD